MTEQRPDETASWPTSSPTGSESNATGHREGGGGDDVGWRAAKRVMMVILAAEPGSPNGFTREHARAVLAHAADLVRELGRWRALAERRLEERDAMAALAQRRGGDLEAMKRKLAMLSHEEEPPGDLRQLARILADQRTRARKTVG